MTATEDPTSRQTLRAAVEMPRSIVADAAAMEAFRRKEGDWSERLFANQASLTDALKAPCPVPLEVRLVSPETWWRTWLDGGYRYTKSLLLKEEWEAQGFTVEDFRIGAPQDSFLHRLIENAFSWALQDCNYLNPKYMDRLIAETIRGMNPEQAAEWNATAPQQAARNSAMETNTND